MESPTSAWSGSATSRDGRLRLHPVAGDDVSIMSRDFAGEGEVLSVISHALAERRGVVVFAPARYEREVAEHGVVINMANVVFVVVLKTSAPSEKPANTYEAARLGPGLGFASLR